MHLTLKGGTSIPRKTWQKYSQTIATMRFEPDCNASLNTESCNAQPEVSTCLRILETLTETLWNQSRSRCVAGHYSYVSLESALSLYGAISQVPIDRLTVLTTGREGEFKTPFGVIEFTHTKRSVSEIIENVVQTGRPLRLATRITAYRDLQESRT